MNSVRLAIDVESGDFGPRIIVSGILEARLLCDQPFKVFICGNRSRIERIIEEQNAVDRLGDYEIIECNDIINPGERRAGVWKKQKSASIIRCISLQKERLVDASISAGDTAILMGAALFILGRSEGALRPALAAFLPTVKKKPVLLLDVGGEQVEVHAHRGQAGVPQNVLQAEHVPAVEQVVLGEGVTEGVG